MLNVSTVSPERSSWLWSKEYTNSMSTLYGHRFTIRTDHAALKWLLNFRYPEGQVARWFQQLQEYDFKIQHRPGKSHSNADTCRPCLSQSCRHCDRMESKEHTALQIDQTSDTAGAIAQNLFHVSVCQSGLCPIHATRTVGIRS